MPALNSRARVEPRPPVSYEARYDLDSKLLILHKAKRK
jgi:hypothetical protein